MSLVRQEFFACAFKTKFHLAHHVFPMKRPSISFVSDWYFDLLIFSLVYCPKKQDVDELSDLRIQSTCCWYLLFSSFSDQVF